MRKRALYFAVFAVIVINAALGVAGILRLRHRSLQLQQCVQDYSAVEAERSAANHTVASANSYGEIDGVELYRTDLYRDPHLLAYYRLEDNSDSKGIYDLKEAEARSPIALIAAKFGNGSDSGDVWQTNVGRYNTNFAMATGTTPVSISAWVSINSQPPGGLDGDFVEVPVSNKNVDYALGYGWFEGKTQIFMSRARLGLFTDRNTYPFTMVPGVFYHLVGTWDGAGHLELYLNGTRVASLKNVPVGDGYSAVAVGLGINGTWSSKNIIQGGVGGTVDDVAIFDRVLTPAEIW